jgi:GAF domain-containing protein
MLVLNELARRISASLDLQATLDAIVTAAFGLIPCALAEVSLWDERSGLLTLQALQCEPVRPSPVGHSFPPGEGYAGWLVRNQRPCGTSRTRPQGSQIVARRPVGCGF